MLAVETNSPQSDQIRRGSSLDLRTCARNSVPCILKLVVVRCGSGIVGEHVDDGSGGEAGRGSGALVVVVVAAG